jgi:hypothetical protein
MWVGEALCMDIDVTEETPAPLFRIYTADVRA